MMKKIIIILILLSFLFSSTVNAISLIKNIDKSEENNPDIKTMGIGGWHDEESIELDASNTYNLEKIGGSGGGWEKPYDGDGLHIWAYHNEVRASYLFEIDDGPVKYVKYGINFKDENIFSDSPDALIYKWDDSWEQYNNLGGYHSSYRWEYHNFDLYKNLYVNSDGEIIIAAQAYDDSSIFQQDDIAIKKVKLSYKSADEEIFLSTINTYDSNNDNSDDSVEIIIDADVGDNGDGTTVDVTAVCELKDSTGNIVDEDELTWTIVDHQSDEGVICLSSMNAENDQYSVHVKLYDNFGNLEDEETEYVYLEPDPQRNIVFNIDPAYSGMINFSDESYYDNESIILSDGVYEIIAEPFEYFIFDHWETEGGITIDPSNLYDPETEVIISDDGILRAVYSFTLNEVFFFIDPAFAGIIQIGQYQFENNSGTYAETGSYEIQAVSNVNNYYFSYWEVLGDIEIEDIYNENTVVNIIGDCIIIAYFLENIPPEKPELPDGPTTGGTQVEYTYSTYTTDIDGNELYYLFDWGDGTDSGWLGPYESEEICTASHKWVGARVYQIKVKARDSFKSESIWSDALPVSIYSPPTAPIIQGSAHGKAKVEQEYTVYATDPDGDDLYYYIDWGDGTFEDWIGPYTSGEKIKVSHTYAKKGTYTIKAQSKDTNDVVCPNWGMFVVTMPKGKSFQLFLQDFLQDRIFLQRIFEKIFELI